MPEHVGVTRTDVFIVDLRLLPAHGHDAVGWTLSIVWICGNSADKRGADENKR